MNAQGEPECGWKAVQAKTLLTFLALRRRSAAETRDHEALQARAEEALALLVTALGALEDHTLNVAYEEQYGRSMNSPT